MLHSIFRRTVFKNLSTNSSAKCSTRNSLTLKKEINRVTLVGTVFGEQFKNDFGQKIIKVKTNDDDSDKYQIHALYTSVPQDYAAGQRVFVCGTLSSKDFVTSENRRRQQSIIKAYQIYALNSMVGDEMKSKDLNSVELLTAICSDVFNKDFHSIFRVVCHSKNKTTQETRPNFHTVLIYDQDLCEFVRNNLEKGDRVYMRGSFTVNNETDADGKKKQSGFIRAETIDKVTKFSRRQSFEEETAFAE